MQELQPDQHPRPSPRRERHEERQGIETNRRKPRPDGRVVMVHDTFPGAVDVPARPLVHMDNADVGDANGYAEKNGAPADEITR